MFPLRLLIALFLPGTLFAASKMSTEVAPPALEEPAPPAFTGYFSLAWDSAFICEGRNFVEEGSLFSSYLQVDHASGFSAWVWGATGFDADFGEIDLGLMYKLLVADFDLGAGYSYGHDFEYVDNFHEAYAWAYYRRYAWLVPGARWKYGDFSGGSYIELSLASEYKCLGDKLTFTPSAILGIDYGYATEDVDDFNNVQLMLAASYALTERLSLNGYVAHSIPLEDMEATGHGDITWGGVSLGLAF